MAEIEYLLIDDATRKIDVPSDLILGVLEDKDVKRVYFKCPKIVGDNVNLSQHQIYVKYVSATDNIGKKFDKKTPGIYHCIDVIDIGDYITFSWLLSGNVFEKEGFVAFSVLASDGEVTRWNTIPAIGTVLITIPGGLEEVAEKYPDIITQLLNRMDEVEAIATPEAMQEYVNTYLSEHPVELDETLTDNTKAAPAGMVGELKSDLSEYLLDSKETIIPGKAEYNMLNPENSIVGTVNMQGVVTENPSSVYLASDFIEVRKSETYAFSYYNTTYNVRYALYPNRIVLYNNNKTFVGQTTNITSENDYFTANRINVSGNTCYLAVTPKTDGYIRIQYVGNQEQPQIAIAPYYEYLKNFSPIPDSTIVEKAVKKGIVTKEQLADDVKNELIKIPVYPNLLHVKLHNSVCCIGDSLTEGYHFPDDIRKDKSYPKFIGQLCTWETENKGMSGITALGWWNTFKDTVDFAKYDAFIVYLGTNGGLTDTIEADTASGDYNTFAQTNTGGYCAICAKIRTVNPNAKIYIVKYGNTTVSNITQSIADKYNCTVLVVTDSTYYNLADSKYHNDATHYNTYGYFCFAHSMAMQIEKYISEHLNEYIDLP